MKAILFLLIATSALADDCRYPMFCEELDSHSFQCSETLDEKVCALFVATMEKSLVPSPCKKFRSLIHQCGSKVGSAAISLHYDRLRALPTQNALALYTSDKLRQTMDGAVAEKHRKLSIQDAQDLGKKLTASSIDLSCRQMEQVPFKSVQKDLKLGKEILPKYQYQEASVADFIVWDGDVKKKIINTKTKTECEAKIGLIVQVSHMKGSDVLFYEHMDGSNTSQSLVNMANCETIWEKNALGKVVTAKVYASGFKRCEPCWNEKKTGCLRN